MAKQYNSFDALISSIQKSVNSALVNEVAEVVKEVVQDEVVNTVYGSYDPIIYQRRMDNGGLADKDMMNAKIIKDGVLQVTDDAPPNSDYGSNHSGDNLSYMVVTGTGYDYGDGSEPYAQPRNFIQAVKDDLNATGVHKDALIKGLKRSGFEVK